jgi:hypothetical protein
MLRSLRHSGAELLASDFKSVIECPAFHSISKHITGGNDYNCSSDSFHCLCRAGV